jgi:hypothetical protein
MTYSDPRPIETIATTSLRRDRVPLDLSVRILRNPGGRRQRAYSAKLLDLSGAGAALACQVEIGNAERIGVEFLDRAGKRALTLRAHVVWIRRHLNDDHRHLGIWFEGANLDDIERVVELISWPVAPVAG